MSVDNQGSLHGSSGGSNLDDDEDEVPICPHCGSMPCDWVDMGPAMLEQVDGMFETSSDGQKIDAHGNPIPHSQVHKTLYKLYISAKYGPLGRGERIPLPR